MKKTFFVIILVIFSISSYAQKPEALAQGDELLYRIKPGDTIEVSVYGEPELDKIIKVSEEGKINYPFIGEVIVGGRTIKEATTAIENLLKKDYFVNPQVSIFIKEYAKFYIMGAVNSEGRYELKGNLSLLDAIALAGGAKSNANLSKVKVMRKFEKEEKEYIIDLYAQGKEFNLEPLDRVVVSEYGSISVLGQVKKPGNYPYKRGITAVDAIAIAGGFTDVANSNAVKVIREGKEGKKESLNVPVGHVLNSGDKSKDIILKEGDVISVPESFF